MELKRVVVTGLGAITPLGNTLPETWEGTVCVLTVLFHKDLSFGVGKDIAVFVRWNWFIFVVINVRCNVLYHKKSFLS